MLLWKSTNLLRATALEIYRTHQRHYSENLRNSSDTLLWKSIKLRDTALEIHQTPQRHCSGNHKNNYNLKALETLSKDSIVSFIYLFLEDSDFYPACQTIMDSNGSSQTSPPDLILCKLYFQGSRPILLNIALTSFKALV